MVGALLAIVTLATSSPAPVAEKLAALEKETVSHLGVVALDTGSGQRIEYRPNARFLLCSTFKFLAAAAVLKKVDDGKDQLDRFVPYDPKDILEYAPVTKEHLAEGGMKLGDLCAAALQMSDNTAGNLLLAQIGGPVGLTEYARSLGDETTRLDRTEPALNVGAPSDERDTTTPAAMAEDLRRIFTTEALSPAAREQLEKWIVGNKTGGDLIRRGVPKSWVLGDKTGRSGKGSTNDIAILRPPGHAPIFLAVYSADSTDPGAKQKAAVVGAARLVAETFGPDE